MGQGIIGIIYDIWGAAIQPPKDKPEYSIRAPLLGINSEAFMHWPDYFGSVMQLCKEARGEGALVWLMKVSGTVHISRSDFSVLYPKLSSLLLKMTANPRRAIDLNINTSLEFLKAVMPSRISAMNGGTNEHLLSILTLETLPEDHKPPERYTAMRLHIPHELIVRLTPQWVRKYKRKRKEQAKDLSMPQDPAVNVLNRLVDFEVGEELLMHVAPSKEDLRRHFVDMQGGTDGGDGMVEITRDEGRSRGELTGAEKRI